MELHFVSFLFFSGIIFLMSLILKVGKAFKINGSTVNLPPGPWKLPLIGSTHHLIGSLPHHRLRQLAKKYGPLMHLQIGEVSTVVVSSAEIAKDVLKSHDIIFAERPRFPEAEILTYNCTDIVTSPYGGYWRQMRKICTLELLSAKQVKSFQSIREDEVLKLIASISKKTGTPVDLSQKFFSLSYAITSRAALGEKCKGQEAVISTVKEIMKLNTSFRIVGLFPSQKWLRVISGMQGKLTKFHREIDLVLENIISEAVKKIGGGKAESLLSVLLNLKDHGALELPMTINNIKAVLMDMFFAGSETSSTVMAWAMSEMLKNPRIMKRAQAEVRQVFGSKGYVDERSLHGLEYLKAVIKETMRLHPPAPLLLPRKCSQSCEINNYAIPAETQVLVNAWAIGRDPKYWKEAEKFFPERFLDSPIDYKGSNFEFIPFGAGKRICPGIIFAAASIELPLAQLLYYFNWELPFGTTHESLDMTEDFGTTAGRKTDLYAVPISQNPVAVE